MKVEIFTIDINHVSIHYKYQYEYINSTTTKIYNKIANTTLHTFTVLSVRQQTQTQLHRKMILAVLNSN